MVSPDFTLGKGAKAGFTKFFFYNWITGVSNAKGNLHIASLFSKKLVFPLPYRKFMIPNEQHTINEITTIIFWAESVMNKGACW